MSPKFVIERLFPASPAALFLAHSNPHLLVSWLAAPNSKGVVVVSKFQKNGYLRYAFEVADRTIVWGRLDYLDIKHLTAISLIQSLTDRDGLTISPFRQSHWLFRLRTDIKFRSFNTKTKVQMTISLYDATPDEQGFFAFLWPRLATEYEAGLDRLSQAVRQLYN